MHPSLKIFFLLTLAVAIQFASAPSLAVLGVVVVLAATVLYSKPFLRVLYRSRWLLLTLVLIYAFTTPGEYVHGWPSEFAPSYEGIVSGMLQTGRLIIMLAALSLLLGSTRREILMSGIYGLLRPLRLLGLAPERFAARLWLTLHYVEQAPERHRGFRWSMFDDHAVSSGSAQSQRLSLTVPAFTFRDTLVACLICVMVAWLVS